MVPTRLLFAVACVLLWTAVTACASADPASQPTSTEAEPTPVPIVADTSDSELDCDKEGVIRWFHAGEDIDDQAPTSTVLEHLRLLES